MGHRALLLGRSDRAAWQLDVLLRARGGKPVRVKELSCCQGTQMGVSQNYGYLFGVPIIRIIVFWGLYWGPPILGNYQIKLG